MPTQRTRGHIEEWWRKNIDLRAKAYCKKMGCPVVPRVTFSDSVDKNSAQTYMNGDMIFNPEYVKLNKKNKVVMKNLIIHECSHLADPDPSGTQHDASFMSVYQRYGIGIKDDPLWLGEHEVLTPPRYATLCARCGNIMFYQGKPRTIHRCEYDKYPMKTIDVFKNKFLKNHWRQYHNWGNRVPKRDLKKI